LDALRHECGMPFRITSGYRSPKHSIEAAKPGGPGQASIRASYTSILVPLYPYYGCIKGALETPIQRQKGMSSSSNGAAG
jgi:hypothetical protein